VLEDVFQNVIGKVRLLATIKGENAKAYLLSCVVDREYFNKVTSNEVRTLLDQNRAKGPVKLTLLETNRIALKAFGLCYSSLTLRQLVCVVTLRVTTVNLLYRL
jgi:hypothetical protein